MPTIDITPEQEERLRAIQDDLAESVVGKYGHVRPRDAVEYLLDQYESDESPDEANAVADGAPAASAAAVTSDEPGDDTAGTTDSDAVARVVDGADGGDADAPDERSPAADSNADDSADGASDDGASDDEASGTDVGVTPQASPGGDASSGGDDAMLDAMMNLLETHEDKWSESTASDERYVVRLPDGDSEHVRTKDDVRALLFKHYR